MPRRPVDGSDQPARLRELAARAAAHGHGRDVEVDAVAAGVRERDRVPSGENAPGTWIASGSWESGASAQPVASIENSAWRSLPPASRAITQRSSLGEGQRGGDALARERDLLVQAVGATRHSSNAL